jgi:hypothetical protein
VPAKLDSVDSDYVGLDYVGPFEQPYMSIAVTDAEVSGKWHILDRT